MAIATDNDSDQTKQFEHMLHRQRATLQAEIEAELRNSDSQQHRELADRIQDGAEEASARLLVDVNLAIVAHHRVALQDVESALNRLVDGTYGKCVECGAPIVVARLESYPTAKRCHPCQSSREQTSATRHD